MTTSISQWLLAAVAAGASSCALAAGAAERPPSGDTRAQAEQVVCRERLHPGSNVHDRVCMTNAEWAKLKRREAREAERQVRVLQGSAYEGGAVN